MSLKTLSNGWPNPCAAMKCEMKNLRQVIFKLICIILFTGALQAIAEQRPNILFILADDVGYGDLQCYNPNSKIPTPNLNKLAKDGMRFTDSHSPSTVCTPTRYSILTGRMQFRTGMKGVFTGAGGPCLIEKERLTLPQMLMQKRMQAQRQT